MRRSAKELLGYTLMARDGEIGKLRDFLFNDATWCIRHVVVDIGSWLSAKLVLLPPTALQEPCRGENTVSVELSRKQVLEAPPAADDLPVSRGFGRFWPRVFAVKRPRDPRLRSTREVTGYDIRAIDGLVGHVEDFIVDTQTWTVRHVVVGASWAWWVGKKVLVAPYWMSHVDWPGRTVHVELTRKRIRGAPTYDPSQPVNLEDEDRAYDYHGRFKYWVAR
jgi:hypothetical protein